MTDLELQSQETEALLKTSERPKKRALAIQIIALCGAAALAGAALASRAAPRDVTVTGLARTSAPADGVVCPQIWEPVCGKDGKTYPNPCMAGAMTFTTGECDKAPPVTPNETLSRNETESETLPAANESLPTNESLPAVAQASNERLPVDVPDRKFTTIPDRVPGCGCSVQTCCDTLAAGEMYLGCQAIFDGTVDRGSEICDQVSAGVIDGDMSVCDLPEIANGPAQLTGTFVPESLEKLLSGDTCIRVDGDAYFWDLIADGGNSCDTFTFPKQGLKVSVLTRCDGFFSDELALPYSICEKGFGCGNDIDIPGNSSTSNSSENGNSNCPPPFGTYGPTGAIFPSSGTPGAVGTAESLMNGQSVVFTVNGKWPCAPPPTPTAAPTIHHHHHDGAVADFRDAALGSVVVAALTAAVLL